MAKRKNEAKFQVGQVVAWKQSKQEYATTNFSQVEKVVQRPDGKFGYIVTRAMAPFDKGWDENKFRKLTTKEAGCDS